MSDYSFLHVDERPRYREEDDISKSKKNLRRKDVLIIKGDDRTLLLDFDTQEQFDHYKKVFKKFKKAFELKEVWVRDSKTPGHRHAVVFSKNTLTTLEKIALQAILGSDPVREAIHYKDFKKGKRENMMLFEKKTEE